MALVQALRDCCVTVRSFGHKAVGRNRAVLVRTVLAATDGSQSKILARLLAIVVRTFARGEEHVPEAATKYSDLARTACRGDKPAARSHSGPNSPCLIRSGLAASSCSVWASRGGPWHDRSVHQRRVPLQAVDDERSRFNTSANRRFTEMAFKLMVQSQASFLSVLRGVGATSCQKNRV